MKTWSVELDTESYRDGEGEGFILSCGSTAERIRLHDYAKVYSVPGLYEHVVQFLLRCRSPEVAAQLLLSTTENEGANVTKMRVLDLGAGNGIVGQLLRQRGVGYLVGIDNIPEAKAAADRDYPAAYDDYLVADLGYAQPDTVKALESVRLTALVCVGALGGGHVLPMGLIRALNVLDQARNLAVLTIHEKWLTSGDNEGFAEILTSLEDCGYVKLLSSRRFTHRVNVLGDPVTYRAMAIRRMRHIPIGEHIGPL